ncbi:MAG TPA: RNA polymerase factor sigma-54 [Alphaproteobacteria bacterium]|nr:RNA polymerase factor sigma-54 [Alphaproteobacteria bacterium]
MSQKITQSLDLRQQHSLVMTPQMQQAVKLLQMNNLELQDFLEAEMVQNPLLEKVEPESEGGDTSQNEEGDDDELDFPDSDSSDSYTDDAYSAQEDFDAGSKMAEIGSGGRSDFSDSLPDFENSLVGQKTLRDHLLGQLHIEAETPLERSLGTLLIDRLDEAGYLREDLRTLAQQFGCLPDALTKVLDKLKTFDPTGVFAHDLSECLALQLEEQGLYSDAMRLLVSNLPLLGQHEIKKLAKLCGVSEAEISVMAGTIRGLNPRPSSEFEHIVAQTAIPDVLMKALPKNIGGGWRVELNSDTLPRVLVNRDYYTHVSSRTNDKQEKEYLSVQLANASWLVKALDQRAQSILKVASEIVERQDGFFLYGIEFLKPLTLREVAEVVDLHESTVSRVTTGKFIGTPRGLLELKFFFTSSIDGTDGGSISSESVKARIKALTDEENPAKVLSDEELVEILNKEGMNIARRTIAKYREALGIPSSVLRRRMKKI